MATRQGATLQKTPMRLTPHHPIESLPGHFCYFRSGHGGSCAWRGNSADFAWCGARKCHEPPCVSFKSGDVMLYWRLASSAQSPMRLVRLRKLKTQNA